MKKMLLSLIGLISFSTIILAQCEELFISTYVEGYGNNRALELYNPSNTAIDLSEYSVGRFSNGGTEYRGVDLPQVMLDPYDVFVVVLDKRNPEGEGLEVPVWDGYLMLGTIVDDVTMEPVLDEDGNELIGVQYDENGRPLYWDTYNDYLDLQGKADVFVCPVYDDNNALYFNGNDAVALIKGSDVAGDGSNILDVVGVIGEDPTVSIMQDAWVNDDGGWITRDKTLVRSDLVEGGQVYIAALGDTFEWQPWQVNPKNTFTVLGSHGCVCDPDYVPEVTMGIEQTSVATKFFPNPVEDGILNINADLGISSIGIYDFTGRVSQVQNLDLGIQTLQLDLGNLSPGLYIARLQLEDGSFGVEQILIK